MTSPLQVDRQAFEVAAPTPDAAMAVIRERAQAVHPETNLDLDVYGEGSREGTFIVIADYWAIFKDSPV